MDIHGKIMNIPVKVPTVYQGSAQGTAYKLGHRDARHAAAELVAATPDPLEAFDAAFQAEIQRVSNVEYNSHDICKHFAGELRKRIAALSPNAEVTSK